MLCPTAKEGSWQLRHDMLTDINISHNYRVVREIAKGGMGSVYEALQYGINGFEKRVAIKTLLPSLSNDRRFVDMFIDEGKLVADLVHENIVQIYQLQRVKSAYLIVMEYVLGLSLRDFIRFHGLGKLTLPVELAVFITSRIARGLAYAHSRLDQQGVPLKIVHRDVCPRNIMITTEGLPKLADFGIAKAATNVMPANDQCLMGKLAYMPPEQARRRPVDYRSDMYSLGLVLFELLALQQARMRREEDLHEAAKEGWVDWDLLPEDTDAELLAIMRRMLAPVPDERYSDTNDLAHDLEYHIYREGYGPTVITLENYLRKNFAYLYSGQNVPRKKEYANAPVDRTIRLPDLE